MRLRIADRSRTVSPVAAGPRWVRFNIVCRKFWRPRAAISCILFFALAAMVPAASASSAPPDQGHSESTWQLARSNPAAIMRKASQNELNNSYGHRPPVRYQLRKKTRNTDTTKEIVETAKGGVARLIAINNKPLVASQERAETQRLRELSADPSQQEHRNRSEQKDAARITGIMRLLPDAFLYREAEPVDPSKNTIHLTFTPNPHFSPPTLESRILTGVRGEVWIDAQDLRVVRIESHLFRTVDYGWGILGTLYPGGTISIEQVKTPNCGWQLARLNLDLTGKKFMFKSLYIVVEETATDYHPVQSHWNYTDAIQWLLQMPAIPVDQMEQSKSRTPSSK